MDFAKQLRNTINYLMSTHMVMAYEHGGFEGKENIRKSFEMGGVMEDLGIDSEELGVVVDLFYEMLKENGLLDIQMNDEYMNRFDSVVNVVGF